MSFRGVYVHRLSINEGNVNNVVPTGLHRVLEDHLIGRLSDEQGYPIRCPVRRCRYGGEHLPETWMVLHLATDSGFVKGCQGRQPHGSVGLDYSVRGVDGMASFRGEARIGWEDLEPGAPGCEVPP